MSRNDIETGLPYSNKGDELTHQFLKRLPEQYIVEREFRIMDEGKIKQPDFIVLHPEIGVVIVEAKDWNLKKHTFTWVNQHVIEKRDHHGNLVDTYRGMANPFDQTQAYKNEMIRKMEEARCYNIFTNSVVCYPLITRQEYLNSVDTYRVLQNNQYSVYIDFKLWIFKDDIQNNTFHPEAILKKIAVEGARSKNITFTPSTESEIEFAKNYLQPSFALVGQSKRAVEISRKEVLRLSEEQMRWVRNLNRNQNYLLDLPGSGKTSALISKAIYLLQYCNDYRRILIVTYSNNLKWNIEELLKNKIRSEEDYQKLKENINILTTDELVTLIYEKVSQDQSLELLDVINLLEADSENEYGIKIFDSIFIDEIQDFDDETLLLLTSISKNNSFFFVGDISQKIYERIPNLENLGFNLSKIKLPKSYKMYRTPKLIAELALKFLLGNGIIKRELENNGYILNNVIYKNNFESFVDFNKIIDKHEIVACITKYYQTAYTYDQIMIITSKIKMNEIEEVLKTEEIPYEINYKGTLDKVALVNFEDSKGLEKEIVLIYGIEDLYERSKPEAALDDESTKIRKQSYSMRKIYIALTRTLEYATLFYEDQDNQYIKELLELNRTLTDRSIS